jgi:hypothetical protein
MEEANNARCVRQPANVNARGLGLEINNSVTAKRLSTSNQPRRTIACHFFTQDSKAIHYNFVRSLIAFVHNTEHTVKLANSNDLTVRVVCCYQLPYLPPDKTKQSL